jgi:flagellar biosynthesis protein FlhG
MTRDQADTLRLIATGQATFSQPFAPAPPPPSRPARAIAIASGKGGVGKTNVAVNLGLALAKRGLAVTIIDLDLGLANIDVILGISPRLTLREVVSGQCDLREALVEGPYGLRVLCGSSGVADLAGLSAARRERLLGALAVIEQAAELILLDMSAGISPSVLDFIAAAGETIIVTTPEPTATTDAYALIKLVHHRAPETAFSLVVNQVSRVSEAEEAARTLIEVAQRFLAVPVLNLGYLPYDETLRAAVKQRRPLLIAYPGCRLSRTIERLADQVCSPTATAVRPVTPFSGVLRRLSGRVA